MERRKVVVGMSGGVDSSVTAYLLKQQGYDVIGVTMQIWQEEADRIIEENGGCCGLSAVEDARRVAAKLDIPYYVMNFRDVFKEKVIDNFISEYEKGRTPNPCIVCNRYVKWEVLLDRALALGADYIATGHYAKVTRLDNGRYAIAKAAADRKDQTYALYNLNQHQLAHTLMPLGDFDKDQTRQIAAKIGLSVAGKPDSQDICFVPDGDYQSFIENYTKRKMTEGNFVDRTGKVLGRHKGIGAYTIGQRKGLNLSMGHPVFVTAIDPVKNEIVIGENEDLFRRSLYASHLNLMACPSMNEPKRLTAKIRYAHRAASCIAVQMDSDRLYVCFDEPQRAITAGQAVVLYDGDIVVGGGIIEGIAPDSLCRNADCLQI